MNKSLVLTLALVVAASCFLSVRAGAAEDEVFSGPQLGEKLPPLKVRGVLGDSPGEEFDPVSKAGGKPIGLIFFHQRTRPAFSLSRAIANYAEARAKDGLSLCVVFLTDDVTTAETFIKGSVRRYFPEGPNYVVSTDGPEGPGAYGLNRNVALTVLVANEGKVTANFALVDPSLQADAQKIAKAIVDALGSGDVPTVEQLAGEANTGQPARMIQDEKLEPLFRALVRKEASEEEVNKTAAEVEKYLAENRQARAQVGRLAARIVNSDRINSLGTPAAQRHIRKWAKEFGGDNDEAPRKRDRKPPADNSDN